MMSICLIILVVYYAGSLTALSNRFGDVALLTAIAWMVTGVGIMFIIWTV